MKSLALILSVFIICMTAKPCDDAVRVITNYNLTVSSEQPVHHHDMCSPFCICQCCQAYFQVTCPPQFEFQQHHTEYDSDYYLYFCSSEPSEFLIPPEIL